MVGRADPDGLVRITCAAVQIFSPQWGTSNNMPDPRWGESTWASRDTQIKL